MFKTCLTLLAFGVSSLYAQSRVDLLQRVADKYKNASSFNVKGIASASIPGTSWQAAYEFETQGVQPTFLPLSLRKSSIQVISNVSHFTITQVNTKATDPKPQQSFAMNPFGEFHDLVRHLVDAQKIGTEIITVQGHTHSCEIIDAAYDVSPEFKPHSMTMHRHFSIDPMDMLVLRETLPTSNGMEWTADVTSTSFDQPPSEAMIQALRALAEQPKDRSDWIGRPIPDITLKQLSGSSMRLADLRGKPILLDFWGSYCPPCKHATLHAQELASRYKSSGLTVLTFTQDSATDAKLWADYNHISLPILLDPDGTAFKAFDVQGIPVAILADESGKIVHYWVGLDDTSSMDSVVNTILLGHPATVADSESRR